MTASPAILLIEDDVTTARIVATQLCDDYTVLIATSGEDGLRLLDQQPDLLLVDLGLPDIAGLELIRTLRDATHAVAAPIIVMSADNSEATIEQALAVGANDYMVKPLIGSLLTTRIRQLLAA